MTMTRPTPLILIILDGWGYREETEANAIAAANKPNWDNIWKTYPHALISGSGHCVDYLMDKWVTQKLAISIWARDASSIKISLALMQRLRMATFSKSHSY